MQYILPWKYLHHHLLSISSYLSVSLHHHRFLLKVLPLKFTFIPNFSLISTTPFCNCFCLSSWYIYISHAEWANPSAVPYPLKLCRVNSPFRSPWSLSYQNDNPGGWKNLITWQEIKLRLVRLDNPHYCTFPSPCVINQKLRLHPNI